MSRRRPRRAQLRRQVERYDSDALWQLITAAGAAPGVRHRWATVGHLLATALHADQRGRRPVGPRELQPLLDACVAEEPQLVHLEDFLPEDPRDEVLTRVDGAVLRLFPGSVERPIADVDRALLVADATDSVLIGRLGFGIRDLVTATLTFIDRAASVMASAWPGGELPGNGPVVLSAGELDAAAALEAAATPAALELTARQERALAWATGAPGDLPYEPAHPQSPFGRYLRVARHGPDAPASWMPLSHVPEILGHAVVVLALTVAQVPEVRRAFAQGTAEATRRALWRFSSTALGTPDGPSGPAVLPGNHIQWVATLGAGRAVLVQLISDLGTTKLPFDEMPAALRVARESSAAPGTPIRVPTSGGSVLLDADVEVVPLLVIAVPGHIAVPQHPGLPAMSLDDLRWATVSADADSDLFLFCRDIARPDRPPFFGWEAINVWEWWRNNGKTLFAGAMRPTMMIAAHAGVAEWDRSRRYAPLERALSTLRLPGLAAIDGIDQGWTGPPVVYQWVDPQTLEPGPDRTTPAAPGDHRRGALHGWTLHLSDVPVAIVAAHPKWPHEYHELLHKLSGAFAFGFRQIDAVWHSAHSDGPVRGYVVGLVGTDSDKGPVTRLRAPEPSTEDGIVRATVEVRPGALATAADQDISTVRDAMAFVAQGLVAAAALPTPTVDDVGSAWRAAPPTLAVQVLRTPTVRNDLPAPLELDPALVAEVDQAVARAVHEAGVQPGTYTGDAAKALDRDVLAPAALHVLTGRLRAFAMDDVILTGMREIERAVADRDREVRNLQRTAQLQLDWDPVRRYAEIERGHLTLRRGAEMVVEAALRMEQHTGTRPLDRVAWVEIAAAADAYLSATTRSEHIHHQVRPTALEISTAYEIEISYDPSPDLTETSVGAGHVYDLDVDAMQRARATLHLGGIADSVESPDHPRIPTPDPGSPTPIVEPELDAALHDAFGASGTDILTTLYALAHWPLTEADDDVVVVTVDSVIEHVLDCTILDEFPDGRARAVRAVTLLTSTSSGLVAADWKPWHLRSRRRRLLIQPLPMLSNGRFVISPHFCLGSLSAYQSHLGQGQLPWTQPAPDEPAVPDSVTKALRAIRDGRNKELERTITSELRRRGWRVIANIKRDDPRRLNVPELSGEIDVVAGVPGSRTLWLLEVKDPADTYVVAEIRRHLDTFFADRGTKLSYSTRLQHKVDDLAPHADAVAGALGLPPRADTYELAAAFVTRDPVPAAFVSSEFPFVSLAELDTLLDITPADEVVEPEGRQPL